MNEIKQIGVIGCGSFFGFFLCVVAVLFVLVIAPGFYEGWQSAGAVYP